MLKIQKLGARDSSDRQLSMKLLASLCLVVLFAPYAASHGSVLSPLPRNAVDNDLSPWTGAVPEPLPAVSAKNFAGTFCPVAGRDGKKSNILAQSCFWFSNGCAIG